MFDPAKLTENDKKILADFQTRRRVFDDYLNRHVIKLFTCPGCAYPTLEERGEHMICAVCNWEDDGQDDKTGDKILGGPNGYLSLTGNRINIGRILLKNADSLKSEMNLDPAYVLTTLEFYDNKKQEIGNRMTGMETIEQPIWVEWQQVEKDLQAALCSKL